MITNCFLSKIGKGKKHSGASCSITHNINFQIIYGGSNGSNQVNYLSHERRLTTEKIEEIRRLRAQGHSYGQIRNLAGVSKSTAYMYGSSIPIKKPVSYSDLIDQAMNIRVWAKIAPQIIERIRRNPLRDPEEIFNEYQKEKIVRNLAGLLSPEEAIHRAEMIEKIKKRIELLEDITKRIERVEKGKELEKLMEKQFQPLQKEIDELKNSLKKFNLQ